MKVVVTAGPTREPIDPVRFISNRSSGKMGFAIAQAFAETNNDVVLIAGPVALDSPANIRRENVETAAEMYDAVIRSAADADVLVMCAAVADYRPKHSASVKVMKSVEAVSLELIPTRDVLKALPPLPNCFVVGFAAETNDLEINARQKLRDKNCDMMVANDVSSREVGMESDENCVTIFTRNGVREEILRAPKQIVARELVKIILRAREKSLTTNS